MVWTASFRNAASRFANGARATLNDTASEFQNKGVGGVFKEAYEDTAEVFKDLSTSAASSMRKAAHEMQQGVDAAANWMAGEDVPSLPPTPSSSSSSRPPRGPVWRPPVPQKPPRLEELRKGTKVYRKGALAEVVKVDYEADPPSLVVRMLEGGNEVGTDAAHVSLGPDESLRCLALGVRVQIVDLQSRKELNGCRGILTEYKADVDRWTVNYSSANSVASEAIAVRPRNLSVLLASSPQAEVPERDHRRECSSASFGAKEGLSSQCPEDAFLQGGPTSTPVGQKLHSEFLAEPEPVVTERVKQTSSFTPSDFIVAPKPVVTEPLAESRGAAKHLGPTSVKLTPASIETERNSPIKLVPVAAVETERLSPVKLVPVTPVETERTSPVKLVPIVTAAETERKSPAKLMPVTALESEVVAPQLSGYTESDVQAKDPALCVTPS